MKFHTSLPVKDIEATKEFYTILFGTGPIKEKVDYLKFLPENINLNLTFSKSENINSDLHLGLQFSNKEELDSIYKRLESGGLLETTNKKREDSICCYARQDKFWVKDPSGYEWEIYSVLEDSEIFMSENSSCC